MWDCLALHMAINNDGMWQLVASSGYFELVTDAVKLEFTHDWMWLEALYEMDSKRDMKLRGVRYLMNYLNSFGMRTVFKCSNLLRWRPRHGSDLS